MTARSWIDALLEPPGQRLLEELSREVITPGSEIALITRLRRTYDPALVATAVEQTLLRRRAREKFSAADRMYFTAAGLEQASSERAAALHARRYASVDRVADLCSGIGGDTIALAAATQTLAVDRDPVHARLVSLNAEANRVADRVDVVCADVRDVRVTDFPAAFVDPARRSADRRFAAGTSEPSLSWCVDLASRGVALGVKAAPALPTDLVPVGWELEFVSEDRELKEAVLWSPALATAVRRATVLPAGDTMTASSPGAPGAEQVTVRAPGAFLLDPDPAVTRAGLVEELALALAESVGACWKIDERIAFLSADAPMRTPFGRCLRVEASMPWSLARLRESLRGLDVGVVDIRKRGSAVDVDEVRGRLKLRGSRSATVVLTRSGERPWALVCVDPVLRP